MVSFRNISLFVFKLRYGRSRFSVNNELFKSFFIFQRYFVVLTVVTVRYCYKYTQRLFRKNHFNSIEFAHYFQIQNRIIS